MALLGLEKTWLLELDTEELRLVLKALGGRLIVGGEDELEARELGNRITELRGKVLKDVARDGDRLLNAAQGVANVS